VLLAALVMPTATATAASKNSFTYGCTLTLEVCEEAGTKAGSDPAAVARYLDTAAKRKSAIAASFAPEWGSVTHDGRNGRFYGWRLSKDVLNGGIKLPYYRCRQVAGQPSNCVHQGDVGVMASFNFNGHQARDIRTVMTNRTPLSLQVRHHLACQPGGVGCSAPISTPISPMPPGPNTEEGTTFYLPDAGTYQLTFAWEIIDPGWSNSRAMTETFGSIRFQCEQLGPPTDPGECYFRGLSSE
jgi:hypothetical protein